MSQTDSISNFVNLPIQRKHLVLPDIWETMECAGIHISLNEMPSFFSSSFQDLSTADPMQRNSELKIKPGKNKKKRTHFSDEQRQILLNWFINHKTNPYPSQNDKDILVRQTGLSKEQINVWFTNNRSRHGIRGIKSVSNRDINNVFNSAISTLKQF